MHVPDGLLPLWVYLVFLVISIPVLGIAIRKVNKRFDDRLTPYMGVLAAVIFAAQFVNFPIPPSSGHLVGTTMLAVMLGPWAAMIIIALVLFVQALYGDGGFLAFGINFFNMGILGAFIGWSLSFILFKGLGRVVRDEKSRVLITTSIASFITIVVTAFILGLELLTVPGLTFELVYVITGLHVFVGVGEAIITFVVLLYFVKAKPKLISFLKESATAQGFGVRVVPEEVIVEGAH